MAARSLWTNFIGPPSVSSTSSNFTLGPCFTPSVDGQVTHLMWYRGATGAGNLPQRISLWNRSSGTKIAEVVAPTDNGVVGWKSYALVTPAGLAAGVTYTVAGDSPSGNNLVFVAPGSKPTPDVNLAWPTNVRGIHTGAMNTFPETQDNVQAILYDIVFDDAAGLPPSSEPASQADVEEVIASWFTLGAGNDHVGQLPNQIHAEITDTDTGLPAILTAINGLATDVLTEESAVVTELRNAVDTVEPILVAALGAGGAMLAGALRTYLDNMKADINDSLQYTLHANAGPQGMAPNVDSGWSEVDSGAFAGTFEVLERCDRVYVHITSVGASVPTYQHNGRDFGGQPWWWAPTFANMLGAYKTCLAREAVLYVEGMRMDGALVVLPPDYEGTYTASIYDGGA